MKRKWLIIFGIIILLFVIALFFIQTTQGLKTKVLEIKSQTIAKTFKEEGQVTAKNEEFIYALYGGKLNEVCVEEGDKVKKGDLLAVFDIQELSFQLQQLQGQLKSTQAQQTLEEKKIALDKLKQLYESGAISQKEYEDAQNTVNSQYYPGLIESLQAQIQLVEYKIRESNLLAPKDGIIADLTVEEGMVLAPSQSMMKIFAEDYQVEVYLLTTDASRVEKGMEVELIQEHPDQDIHFTGTLEKIAPTAVEKLSPLGLIEQRLKLTINPHTPEQVVLRPGYALDVVFTMFKEDNRLVVPKTALFSYQGQDAVWVVSEGKAAIQLVKKGFENERDVVIEDGLQKGDLVILNPQLKGISEGKKINIE